MPRLPTPGRYAHLDFNAPLSSARANAFVRALGSPEPMTVLDVGCGWAELLLRVLAASPQASGEGIDTDAELLDRAHANAAARGLVERTTFLAAPAPREHDPADLVICIGADHAYGSQHDALGALYQLVRPGGHLLFGSGFWERAPTPAQAASLGMEPGSLPDLAGLVDLAIDTGFRPLKIEAANQDEWDAFESGYLADWEDLLHRMPGSPQAAEARAQADTHRTNWLKGYRTVLGFAYLTLGKPSASGAGGGI